MLPKGKLASLWCTMEVWRLFSICFNLHRIWEPQHFVSTLYDLVHSYLCCFPSVLVDNNTAEISTWEPKAKRSDRHSGPVLLFLSFWNLWPAQFLQLWPLLQVCHSALHRSLDAPTLGIRAPCHLPYTTVLSTPWRTFVNSLVLYVLCTPQCLE